MLFRSRTPQDMTNNTVTVGNIAWPCPEQWGAQTALLLRPEDIQLGAVQAGWGSALITRRVFLGERVQLQLHSSDQMLKVEVARDNPYQAGDNVGVWIAPERLMPCHPLQDAA